MKEEIDWKKEFLKVEDSTESLKEISRKWSKEFHARNLSWIHVFQIQKDKRFRQR